MTRLSSPISRLATLLALTASSAFCFDDAVSLPKAKVGQSFSYQIAIDGGVAPYTFTVSSGTLPPGISLNGRGILSGTPTGTQRDPFSFAVQIRDDANPPQVLEQAFVLPVQANAMRIVAISLVRVVAPAASANAIADEPAIAKTASTDSSGGNIGPLKPARTLSIVDGDDQNGQAGRAAKKALVLKLTDADKQPVSGAPITFKVTGDATLDPPTPTTDKKGQVSASLTFGATPSTVSVLAAAPGAAPVQLWLSSADAAPPNGTLTRTLVGIEQSGASSAPSTDKFFFDLFISRPLGNHGEPGESFGSPFRWWGSVRIGTTPIQTTAALSSFASNISQQAKGLTLNQLAQAGEFQTGFEYQLRGMRTGLLTPLYHDREYSTFGFFTGLGAILPFNSRSSLDVYDLPSLTNAQGAVDQGRSRFNSQFPQLASTTATQVAFTTPDRNQFFRQYFAGVRLTTLYQDKDEAQSTINSLGSVSFSVGQNEAISGGKFRGLVAQAEGFIPLPIGLTAKTVGAFYLFGRAAFQLSSSVQQTPLLLNQTNPQPATLGQSLLIANPSRRDIYTIGVGVDAIRFLKGILTSVPAK